jgi:hypothetical protein
MTEALVLLGRLVTFDPARPEVRDPVDDDHGRSDAMPKRLVRLR